MKALTFQTGRMGKPVLIFSQYLAELVKNQPPNI